MPLVFLFLFFFIAMLMSFLKYKFIYFNWKLITLQYCIGFAAHHFGFAFAPRTYAMWVLKWQTWWSVNSILCIPNTMELLKALFSFVAPFVDFKSSIQSKEIETSSGWGGGLGQISLVLFLCSSFFYQILLPQVWLP